MGKKNVYIVEYFMDGNVLSDKKKKKKKYLEEFHKCYVLVPTDKAGNNVLIVCKNTT